MQNFCTKSMFENSRSEHHEAGSFANQHAGSVRYRRSAGSLPAGSGGILPPVPPFQTGSKPNPCSTAELALTQRRGGRGV